MVFEEKLLSQQKSTPGVPGVDSGHSWSGLRTKATPGVDFFRTFNVFFKQHEFRAISSIPSEKNLLLTSFSPKRPNLGIEI